MNHRIFIAINPIKNIREKIYRYQERCPDLPIRWTPKRNLHITVSFLGEVPDENITKIIDKTQKVAQNHTPFFITLNKICYGPLDKKPRMVWMIGEKSKPLGDLKTNLEKELFNLPERNIHTFKNGFTPHITLGRLRKAFNGIRPEERPEVEENLFIRFETTSIDIIESELKRSGAQYRILQTVNLGKF